VTYTDFPEKHSTHSLPEKFLQGSPIHEQMLRVALAEMNQMWEQLWIAVIPMCLYCWEAMQ